MKNTGLTLFLSLIICSILFATINTKSQALKNLKKVNKSLKLSKKFSAQGDNGFNKLTKCHLKTALESAEHAGKYISRLAEATSAGAEVSSTLGDNAKWTLRKVLPSDKADATPEYELISVHDDALIVSDADISDDYKKSKLNFVQKSGATTYGVKFTYSNSNYLEVSNSLELAASAIQEGDDRHYFKVGDPADMTKDQYKAVSECKTSLKIKSEKNGKFIKVDGDKLTLGDDAGASGFNLNMRYQKDAYYFTLSVSDKHLLNNATVGAFDSTKAQLTFAQDSAGAVVGIEFLSSEATTAVMRKSSSKVASRKFLCVKGDETSFEVKEVSGNDASIPVECHYKLLDA